MKFKILGFMFGLKIRRIKKNEKNFYHQEAYFKRSFKRYFASKEPKEWKLWARSTEKEGVEWYLGSFDPVSRKIERSTDFYVLPWDVQKSAERLFHWVVTGEDPGGI